MTTIRSFYRLYTAGCSFAFLFFILTCSISGSPIDYSTSESGSPIDSDWYISKSSRSYISLSGSWQYSENGDDWNTVTIPSVFEGQKNVRFKRTFIVPDEHFPRSSFQLLSFGINYYSEVSINGQFIGKHAGATPFLFSISDNIIKPGSNSIEIQVNNVLNVTETVPLNEQFMDPKNYGGIFRKIGIMISGKVWSDEGYLEIRSAPGQRQLSLMYHTTIHSGSLASLATDSARRTSRLGRRDVEHTFEIVNIQTGLSVYKSDAHILDLESDRTIPFTVPFSLSEVQLWSPSTPSLYLLRRTLSVGGKTVDDVYQTIGFRTLSVNNGSILLNGEKIYLRGIVYHEYSPVSFSALPEEDVERDVLLIKNLGANAIRVRAGSINPYLLSLCDRYGLLVLYDIPLYGTPSSLLTERPILSTITNRIGDFISWYSSRPSVAGLGLAADIDGHSTGYGEYFSRIIPNVRERNSFLSYASFASIPADTVDLGPLDFISFDPPASGIAATLKVIEHWGTFTQHSNHPVIIGSIKYLADTDNYNGYSDPRSIDAQAKYFLDLYPHILTKPFQGCFINSFADWQSAQPLLYQIPDQREMVTTGLVDARRQKRLTYDVIKVLFNNEKPPSLVIGSYSEVHSPVFIISGIVLIFLFAVMYNLFKRFRENVIRSILRPYNFYADIRDQRLLSTFQTTITGILGALSASLYMTNILYFWKYSFWFDYFVSQFIRSTQIKEYLNYLAWYPLFGVLVGTFVLFLLLLLFALFLRLISLIFKKKILLFDAYSISMWSILPMLFLAPIGMILHRILVIPAVEILAPAILIIFFLWIISRILKGTAIIFEMRPAYMYFLGYAIFIACCAIWIGSLDRGYAILDYLGYGWNMFFHYHSYIS